MNNPLLALAVTLLAVLMGGCGKSTTRSGGRSDGTAGAAGAEASSAGTRGTTGGATGSDGGTAGGGTRATGGQSSRGGRTGARSGTGGALETGGTSPGGGMGPGGTAGTGGVAGTTGGAPANGGTAGTGGVAGTTGGAPANGGAPGTGGVASTTGGAPETAGTQGTGGSSGSGDLTPQEMVEDMGVGWNLGNSFDASPDETAWGNPPTTQAMVQAVKAAGFKTMRIPVTWTNHLGAAPDYTIDAAWMDKVEQVVKWTLDAGMYAIVNTHHDADDQWIVLSTAAESRVTTEVTAVWKQIATRFRDYGQHLIFETFNEPHGPVNPYSGGNAEQQRVLNTYIAAAVKVIRETNGNNAQRAIMIQPHGASPYESGVKALAIPDDPNLIISLHTYYPNDFSFGPSPTTWGNSAGDYTAMAASLDQIRGWLPNRAIVIGEWGTVSGGQLESRVAHAKAYTQDVIRRGMCPIWWDNGGSDFALLNRKANPPSWTYPTIVSALMDGAKAGAAPDAADATRP